MSQFFAGFLLALLIALIAKRAHSLSGSGALAAAFVGTVIFGIGGWQWAILLLAFFITSTLLSHAFDHHKKNLDEKYSKGHERDAGQVFGNGAVAALFAALHFFFPKETWPWLGFAASLAAVNADTWATELGVLNPGPPRMITKLGKVVEKGTSGGISPVGTFASFCGAALIGCLAILLNPVPISAGSSILLTLAGVSGSMFDSLLGSTVQAIYFCPKDNKETEHHPTHSCGTPTVQIRGWGWLDNDRVNFACGAFGVVAFFILHRLF